MNSSKAFSAQSTVTILLLLFLNGCTYELARHSTEGRPLSDRLVEIPCARRTENGDLHIWLVASLAGTFQTNTYALTIPRALSQSRLDFYLPDYSNSRNVVQLSRSNLRKTTSGDYESSLPRSQNIMVSQEAIPVERRGDEQTRPKCNNGDVIYCGRIPDSIALIYVTASPKNGECLCIQFYFSQQHTTPRYYELIGVPFTFAFDVVIFPYWLVKSSSFHPS